MKKFISLFLTVAILAITALAFAGDGEFITDVNRNSLRYSTQFAPNQYITASLNTKGVLAQSMAGVSQYKFKFVTTSDLITAATGTIYFGTGTVWNTTGYGVISGGDTWTVGKGVSNVTFSAWSSATPKTVQLWLQKRN